MYKQEIQEVENEIRYLSTHNGNTITINALKNALNELIALQEQYEAKLAKKEQQTKQEQEKERQEALKQAQLEKAQAKLNALLAQCSTPPPKHRFSSNQTRFRIAKQLAS